MANKSHIQPITKLRIKGFKSIQDQTIPLNHANVLLGANGAGKTNLLSVFNLLGNVLRKGLSLSTVCMSLPQVFYQGEETTSSLEIEVFFANSTSYGFTLIPKNGFGLKIQQEYISKNGQYTYLQNANGAESVWETEVHEKHLLYNGEHCGSHSVRNWIEQIQPKLWLCGHIHENNSASWIGKTLVLNCACWHTDGVLRGWLIDTETMEYEDVCITLSVPMYGEAA